jgi:hypothetical protein
MSNVVEYHFDEKHGTLTITENGVEREPTIKDVMLLMWEIRKEILLSTSGVNTLVKIKAREELRKAYEP